MTMTAETVVPATTNTPTPVDQLCGFMELNSIHYLETRSRKAHYGINTIIEANSYAEEEEEEEEEETE